MNRTLCRDNPDLSKMPGEAFEHLGPLAHEHLADLVMHQNCLVIDQPHIDEGHRGACYDLTERRRIGRILLLALDLWHSINRLLRRSRHSGNVTADRSDDRLSFGGSLQAVSRSQDLDFVTFAPTVLGGYTLIGLRGSVKLHERFELFARVENLLDEDYETVSGYGTLDRNAHAGVRVRL